MSKNTSPELEQEIARSAQALVELMEAFVANPTPSGLKELEKAQFAHDVLRYSDGCASTE